MKRFTTLALLVVALAAVPAALADDGATPPAQPAAQQQARGGDIARTRIELLRLRLQIAHLRLRLHCGRGGGASPERCTAFAQKLEDRLTTLDGKVQARLAELKACTPASSEASCKNADRKIALLTTLDEQLRNAIKRVQDRLAGTTTADAPSDSALDQAVSPLGGSNG